MASKTKKALDNVLDLASSKLFLSIIIIEVVCWIFTAFYTVINKSSNMSSHLTVLFSVINFVLLVISLYGMILIHQNCKNREVSYKGFTVLLWTFICEVAVGLLAYTIELFYAAESEIDGNDPAELVFGVVFVAVMLLPVLAMAVAEFVIEIKAILYLRDFKNNIEVRPKRLILLFIVLLITLFGDVTILFVDMIKQIPVLVSEFTVFSLFKLLILFANRTLIIISASLYAVLVYKFNKIMKPLIK